MLRSTLDFTFSFGKTLHSLLISLNHAVYQFIKNVKFILSKRLKSLEFDKPKKALPYNYFLQQNIKSCESEKQREKLKELGKKWQNLSAAEKEPYYEPINRYRNELSVWKEKTKQDGRYKNIEAVKKLLRQLKM